MSDTTGVGGPKNTLGVASVGPDSGGLGADDRSRITGAADRARPGLQGEAAKIAAWDIPDSVKQMHDRQPVMTADEIVRRGIKPGAEGVRIDGKPVTTTQMYALSQQHGVEYALTQTRDPKTGKPTFRLYSGSQYSVSVPGTGNLVERAVAHTHPTPNGKEMHPSYKDMKAMQDRFQAKIDRGISPTGARERQVIVWGDKPGQATPVQSDIGKDPIKPSDKVKTRGQAIPPGRTPPGKSHHHNPRAKLEQGGSAWNQARQAGDDIARGVLTGNADEAARSARAAGLTDKAVRTTRGAAIASKAAGRVLLPVGVALDVHAVATSDDKVRTGTAKATAWGAAAGGAWGGAKVGAAVGAFGGPVGAAVGGVVGGIAGGLFGYFGGEYVGGQAVDAVRGN